MDESKLEVKVGALALVALALGAGLVFALAGVRGGDTASLQVDFGYAGGISPGAVVKLAGIKVGRVREVTLRPEARDAAGDALPVRMTVDVERKALTALGRDATASVAAQGALGEMYLELMPGHAREPLPPDATLRGIDPPRLDVLLSRVSDFFADAQNEQALRSFLVEVARLARTVSGLVGENRAEVVEFLRTVAETLETGQRTMQDARRAVSDARLAISDVRTLSRHADQLLTSPELRGLVADLAETSKHARAEVPGVLRDTRSLVANLERTAGALKPEDVERLRQTLARFETLAGELNKMSTTAGSLLAGIQKGEGTAGMMVKDPKVYQDLRDLLDDLKKHPWKFIWKD
jgi:phospholipid/cholesterol/gamma-HCH transport system substrate-binding protein